MAQSPILLDYEFPGRGVGRKRADHEVVQRAGVESLHLVDDSLLGGSVQEEHREDEEAGYQESSASGRLG